MIFLFNLIFFSIFPACTTLVYPPREIMIDKDDSEITDGGRNQIDGDESGDLGGIDEGHNDDGDSGDEDGGSLGNDDDGDNNVCKLCINEDCNLVDYDGVKYENKHKIVRLFFNLFKIIFGADWKDRRINKRQHTAGKVGKSENCHLKKYIKIKYNRNIKILKYF